ncbi:MAG: hypothetical protein ABL929_05975 [Ferruginibacter sp.]|nr:hypothetical protein [Ferruginibacter sp.]
MDKIIKLKQFLIATPSDSFLQHALALEYIKIGNDIDAKILFETILAREETYIGSYYHLGKLLERLNQNFDAIQVYKNGMHQAKTMKDNHAYNELQAALEDLEE